MHRVTAAWDELRQVSPMLRGDIFPPTLCYPPTPFPPPSRPCLPSHLIEAGMLGLTMRTVSWLIRILAG